MAHNAKEVKARYSPDPYTFVFGEEPVKEVTPATSEALAILNNVEAQLQPGKDGNTSIKSLIVRELVQKEVEIRKDLGVKGMQRLKQLKQQEERTKVQIAELENAFHMAFGEGNWDILQSLMNPK